MNSLSRPFTVRLQPDSVADHASAFRTALDLFGKAELADFLPDRDHPRFFEILCELVRLELAHSWKIGKPIALEAFRSRHPELFTHPVLVYQVARTEFDLRCQAGEKPTMTEYSQRFHLKRDLRQSPLDPDVSSKLDIALFDAEMENYPATVQPVASPAADWPGVGLGHTRRGKPGESHSSDPEIVWKLNEQMREMPKVGEDFLGFSLLAELGKGAFGKVFLAQQADLAGRFVALKVATGLFTESQTLAQLQHSHIVPIYSYHHGQPFQAVCMPYLGSTTLAHILADIRTHKSMPSSGKELLSTLNGRKKSTRRFDESSSDSQSDVVQDASNVESADPAAKVKGQASAALLELEGMSYVDSILWLAVRLADGLAHAHERGIVHRDLKPANILLTDDGLPMLLDFNLAQDTKDRENAAAASIGGTLPYMAPEHLEAFRGKEGAVDARSDLYSLGIILFELLTGAAPFASYRKLPTREVVNRMIDDRKAGGPRLRKLNATIPAGVEAIVHRCLEADPAHRYQTVGELREDLQRQLEHKPLKYAPNTSWWERSQKFRRRHPRLTSVTSVVCLALVAIGTLASAFAYREEHYARLEAKETLARFAEGAETSYFLLNGRTGKHRAEEGQDACRQALGQFQVLDNPAWREAPAVRRLPLLERQRLNDEVCQLLVLLAHTQQMVGENQADPARRQELFEEGLRFCSLAADCFAEGETPKALWQQRGELQARLNDRAQAQESFERARQSSLKTTQDRYLTARRLAEDGKYLAALPLIRDAVRQTPQDFNLNFLQGICHDHLGQTTEAMACYRTCIALRPTFFGSYYNRGLTYLRMNDCKAALADLDEASRLRPSFLEIHVHRALAYQGLKRYEDAIADLTTALDQGFKETRVYFLRAKVREQAGDADGAKADLAEGLRNEPADELSWIARGLAYLPADPKRALHDFDQALAVNPRSFAALTNKAHVLAKYLQRVDEAIRVFDKAVELFPDDARPRAGRGVYLARLGKREAAIIDAEQAILMDTRPSSLYQCAGIYALTSKQVPQDQLEAMKLLSAALKAGFGFEYLDIDRDLDPIRALPAFRRVTDGARAIQSAAAKKKLP